MSWAAFKNQVKTRGLARTNRFRVVIPFPTTGTGGIELAELFCETVNLPGINIATTPQRIFGEQRELPYEKIYDPVSMTFYVDSQMTVKTAFDRWIAKVIDPNVRTVQYYESYIKPIEIYVVGVDDVSPYKMTLYEAYPKTIGSIQMSSESKDVMRLPVTFQYKYWKVESTSFTASQILSPSFLTLARQNVFVGPIISALIDGIP